MEKKLRELEKLKKPTDTREFYNNWIEAERNSDPEQRCIEINILREKTNILKRWTKVSKKKFEETAEVPINNDTKLNEEDKKETRRAMNKLISKKSPGSDNTIQSQ